MREPSAPRAARPRAERPHAKPAKSSEMKVMVCRRMKAAGMAYNRNQSAIARELGIDVRQLNGYYQEKNYPDEALLVKFCELTGCTLDWIFMGLVESQLPLETVIHITLSSPDLIVRLGKRDLLERALEEAARRAELVSEGAS